MPFKTPYIYLYSDGFITIKIINVFFVRLQTCSVVIITVLFFKVKPGCRIMCMQTVFMNHFNAKGYIMYRTLSGKRINNTV